MGQSRDGGTLERPGAAEAAPIGAVPVAAVLTRRFLDRSQRFRRNGAIAGVVLMLAYAIASASLGGNDGSLNLVAMASIGLAGSIVGSILAEAFRVRRPGPRIASLDVRDPDAYRDRTADRRGQVLLALAAAGVAGALVTGQGLASSLALGSAVIVLALLRRWALHRIALRPRPALPAEVHAADDDVRRLASSAGTSRPMVTLGALLVASQWAGVVSATDPGAVVGVVSLIAGVGSVVLFVVACRWWWTNRSFGLDPAQLRGVGGTRSHLGWWTLATIGVVVAMIVVLALARTGS